MVQINVEQNVERYDGEILKIGGEALTLRRALLVALDLPREMVDVEQKLRRLDLMTRIYKTDGLIDLKAEEIAQLKADADETFPTPSALGAIHGLLDPE